MTTPYSAARGNEANDERDSIHEFAAATNALIETLIDGVRGFETAGDQVDGDTSARLAEMARIRREQTERIITIAADSDMDPVTLDDDGTVGATLHRAWMGLRDAVQGDDGVIASAINGEQHARDEINRLADDGLPSEITNVTSDILASIDENLAELGKLKARID